MSNDLIKAEVLEIAQAARDASGALGCKSAAERDEALRAMAAALRAHVAEIVEANGRDMDAAREAGTKESLLDRLMLDEGRVEAMAEALEDLVALPDPLGEVQEERVLYNGIELTRVSVPLGVVAVVYEARPNVTADAAGSCLKAGNACVLRGGSMAAASNAAISRVLHDAAVSAGMPRGCIGSIASTDRAATDELMQLHGTVDVLIPRGGAGLIRHCVECSKVPVIETGTGNCHVYVHESADLAKATAIVENAKCRRYGVCNAAEKLLVHKDVAAEFLPQIAAALAEANVVLQADTTSYDIISGAAIEGLDLNHATEEDWDTEYLALKMGIKVVSDLGAAIDHINTHSTGHTESIIAEDYAAIEEFTKRIDSAVVMVNASTRFTDGGVFGFGAELGISTQKMHARGPMGLREMTTTKWIGYVTGQVRA